MIEGNWSVDVVKLSMERTRIDGREDFFFLGMGRSVTYGGLVV